MTEAVERPVPTGEGLTFEKVWAMFQESKRESEREWKEIHEMSKETERKFQESKLEFDRKLQESKLEHDRMIQESEKIYKRINRQMGKLSNKFGTLAEHLVAPGIVKRFNELGLNLSFGWKKGGEITDSTGKTLTQIDLLLENEKLVIAVEVKATPSEKDIGHHKRRLEILKEKLETMGQNHRKILGAIAGAIYEDSVKKATWDAGFYVIEQSGDTMKIDKPEGWVPVAD
jgi:hypothetical protein